MIALVVVGRWGEGLASEEMAFGWRQLQRALPAGVPQAQVAESGREALRERARQAATERGLAPGDRVLVLAHPHLMFAPGSLSALEVSLDSGAAVVHAFDSRLPNPAQSPDYCTWRGMERYASALPSVTGASGVGLRRSDGGAGAVMSLYRVDALATPTIDDGLAAAGAYVHDYADYRSGRRLDILPFIPSPARQVLDVGGGEGGFLEALKQARPSCVTHLAEYSEAACRMARARVDHVWPGDFMQAPFDRRFDCITFLDVLEHAVEPLAWLQRAAGLLADDGVVIASIPNVGHWSVVADLLEGRWDYAPVGIHCITHLRFFTAQGIRGLFDEAGFAIDAFEATRIPPPPWFDPGSMGGRLAIDADSLSAYAYTVRGRRRAG